MVAFSKFSSPKSCYRITRYICVWTIISCFQIFGSSVHAREPVTPSSQEQEKASPQKPSLFLDPHKIEKRVEPSQMQEEAQSLGLSLRGKGYFYPGSSQERFSAMIGKDGVVTFYIDPKVQVKTSAVCAVAICVFPGSRSTKTSKQANRQKAQNAYKIATTALAHLLAAAANDQTSSSQAFMEGLPHPIVDPVTGTINNSYVMIGATGKFGYLPPSHSDIMAFLHRTFDFRLKLVTAAYHQHMNEQLARLSQELIQQWNEPNMPLEQRKVWILEQWVSLERLSLPLEDVVLEQRVEEQIDSERREMANKAQNLIIKFVQTQAPQDSAQAFTEAELATFNRQRPSSVPIFAPYSKTSAPASKN